MRVGCRFHNSMLYLTGEGWMIARTRAIWCSIQTLKQFWCEKILKVIMKLTWEELTGYNSVCVIFSIMRMFWSKLLLRHIPMSSRSSFMSSSPAYTDNHKITVMIISPSGSFNMECVDTFLITLYLAPISACLRNRRFSLRSRCQALNVWWNLVSIFLNITTIPCTSFWVCCSSFWWSVCQPWWSLCRGWCFHYRY